MGSRSTSSRINKTDLAYIAGFLDGDGSIMLQVKKRNDTTTGWRLMHTICFYQDTRHEKTLFWIKKKLRFGYISKRKDGITELRINGYNQCKQVLEKLEPFIRFKQPQVRAVLKSIRILERKSVSQLTPSEKRRLLNYILEIQHHNYQSRGKRSKEQLMQALGLTP